MNPRLRTAALFAALTALLVGVGYLIAALLGGGLITVVVFLSIAVIMNIIAYFASDRIVLWSYRARILEENELPWLHLMVRDLAARAGIPKPRVALVPTSVPNAFATGRSPRHAVVAVTDGLLRTLNKEEIEAVIAHELGHVKHRDTLVMTVAATIASAFAFMARVFVWRSFFSNRDARNLAIVILVAFLAAIGAMLLQMAISRQREFYADEFSARTTKQPMALASGLRKIEASVRYRPLNGNPASASLFIVNPFRGGAIIKLFSTHPPTEERIARLREIAREMGIFA